VWRNMRNLTKLEVFHPCEDGVSGEGSFLRLLAEAMRTASKGRRRVELRELQRALLELGWHP